MLIEEIETINKLQESENKSNGLNDAFADFEKQFANLQEILGA